MEQARDLAEQANTAKSRFLARVSHELRTPLNNILGMAQLLGRDPTLNPAQSEQVLHLHRAGEHLLAIVNDILDLARAEANRLELTAGPVRLAGMIERSAALVRDIAEAHRIRLRVETADGLPVAVLADELRVRQILIKFSAPQGEVVLRVAPLGTEDGIRFSVLDTGPGVAAEIRPYLFKDLLIRAGGSVTPDGTGMGLAISASLVQAMGGTIGYEPGPGGKGSLFIVDLHLPATSPPPLPAATAPPPQTITPEAAARLRILVVDDVAANRRLAEILLRREGFMVELAEDGPTALGHLTDGPRPHLILMDIYMPGMDGLAVTRHIRSMPPPLGTVPIIALTADATVAQIRACHDAGINDYVAKPFNVDDLMTAISRALATTAPA
jgi:CheY-like chemotaxis protein